jgi:hypothetical protein
MDEFEKNVDTIFDTAFRWSKVVAIISGVIGLGLLGLIVWAVISLVLHFT